MFNVEQTAQDLTGILLSSVALQNVNVKSYRKLRLQNVVDFSVMVTAGRNGRYGAGALVLEPYARGNQKNVLLLDWVFPIISIECPSINDLVTGTNLTAYQIAQIVADNLHNYADEALGTFNVDNVAIEDEKQFELDGCVCKRTSFHILGRNSQTVRVGQLTNSIAGGNVTLSCALNPTANIYYTNDGSFPSITGNPSSTLYQNPIAVRSGQIIRAVGYGLGLNNGACMNLVVP